MVVTVGAILAAPTSLAAAKEVDEGFEISSINSVRTDGVYKVLHVPSDPLAGGSKFTPYSCDDCAWNLPLSRPFSFYGTTYTRACFSSNGLIGLGSCSWSYLNSVPGLTSRRGVAPAWDDLYVSCSNEGWFRTVHTDSVTYRFAGHHFGNAGCARINFQATFHDNGDIKIDYGSWSGYMSATAGISKGSGTTLWALHNENMNRRQGLLFTPDLSAPLTSASLSGTEGNAGWFTSDVTVTLAATDVHDTTTRVRVNGGPFADYGAPFVLSGDGVHDVAYFSTDSVGNVEDTRSVNVKIDASPPTAAITSPAPGFVYAQGAPVAEHPAGRTLIVLENVTFQASASDDTSGLASLAWSMDGVVVGSGPSYLFDPNAIPTGTHTITVQATDVAGNVGPSVEMTFDSVGTTPPVPPDPEDFVPEIPEDPTELIPEVPEDPTELIPEVPEDPTELVPEAPEIPEDPSELLPDPPELPDEP